MTEAELVGPDEPVIEDELVGPDGQVIKDGLAGQDRYVIEDEEQDGTSEDDGLVANPGLVEAPDDRTVVQRTGAARSVPGTTTGRNLPHSQNPHGKSQGGKKRRASNTGGSTGSGGSGGSVKTNQDSTNAKEGLMNRRQRSGRQDDVLRRHRQHSVSTVKIQAGTRTTSKRGQGR